MWEPRIYVLERGADAVPAALVPVASQDGCLTSDTNTAVVIYPNCLHNVIDVYAIIVHKVLFSA